MSDESAPPVSETPADLSPKQARKLERLIETRALEPWERYHALLDVLDASTDLLELADRKTRFALIIMGLLNAVNFLLVARSDVLGVQSASIGTALAIYTALYAFLSLFFFSQADEALRPRSAKFFRESGMPVGALSITSLLGPKGGNPGNIPSAPGDGRRRSGLRFPCVRGSSSVTTEMTLASSSTSS